MGSGWSGDSYPLCLTCHTQRDLIDTDVRTGECANTNKISNQGPDSVSVVRLEHQISWSRYLERRKIWFEICWWVLQYAIYPSETHLIPKARLLITYFLVSQSFFKFCTEHGSDTVVLFTKFQNYQLIDSGGDFLALRNVFPSKSKPLLVARYDVFTHTK